MKTSELIGPALDWAVAKALYGNRLVHYRTWLENTNEYWKGKDCSFAPTGEYRILSEDFDGVTTQFVKNYSTNWSQGGPIIERENITIIRANSDYVDGKNVPRWFAETDKWVGHGIATSMEGEYFDPCFMVDEAGGKYGPTPLIAAMRCYVASKLGDEVEIPEALL